MVYPKDTSGCNQAIRYSGFGIHSGGPVGNFLDGMTLITFHHYTDILAV